jgi:5-methylcytosine-specific restriction endonuclease McrA
MCQICHTKLQLNVHHIVPYRITEDNSEENLITLFKSCHKKMDIMYMDLTKQPMYYNIINKWRINGKRENIINW